MRHVIRWLIVLALLSMVVSTLRVYPHQLVYFNELAGGPEKGHEHLLHSSLDWGQDLLCAAEWQRKHPSESPVFYLLRCSHDPQVLGIHGVDLHLPNWCETLLEKARDHSLTILLSKHSLLEESDCFSKLDVEIIDHVGMSILAVRVKPTGSQSAHPSGNDAPDITDTASKTQRPVN